MSSGDNEEKNLRAAALQNAASILLARQRAERELLDAKEALERKTGELAHAAAELGEQREWFRVTLSSIGDAVITTDLASKITFLNPVAEQMTGWLEADARGLPLERVFHIIHEETRQPAENPIAEALRHGAVVELANHTSLISRDGREIAIEDSAAPIRNASGNVTGAVMVFHDVTKRRRAESALRQEIVERGRAEQLLRDSETRLRVALQAAAIGTWEIELATNTVTLDERCQEMFGASGRVTMSFDDFVAVAHVGEREQRREALRRVITRESDHYAMEYRIGAGDRWSKGNAKPVHDREGRVVRVVGAVVDITQMMKARATMEERGRELERVVGERTASLQRAIAQMEEFSYSVSHDLRAPLRAIQTYAQVVLDDFGDKVGAEGTEFLQRIVNAGNRMDRLTREVLTYSKVARADAPLFPVSLDRLVAETVEQYVPVETRPGAVTVAHPLLAVVGSEPLLVQAISNLLANALKFVAAGSMPQVHIRTEKRDDDVRLWVEDNGIGIPPEFHHRIWGMFERLHQKDGFDGTGIGLAIVRKAVERMGGTVGVESDGEHGSRFWIQLRAA